MVFEYLIFQNFSKLKSKKLKQKILFQMKLLILNKNQMNLITFKEKDNLEHLTKFILK